MQWTISSWTCWPILVLLRVENGVPSMRVWRHLFWKRNVQCLVIRMLGWCSIWHYGLLSCFETIENSYNICMHVYSCMQIIDQNQPTIDPVPSSSVLVSFFGIFLMVSTENNGCADTLWSSNEEITPVQVVERKHLHVEWDELLRYNIHNKTMKFQVKMPPSGKILTHCKRMVCAFRESMGVSLCIFKIGVTADPVNRFSDYQTKAFSVMWIIYVSDDLSLTHMLEAALISEFNAASGCRNAPGSGVKVGSWEKNIWVHPSLHTSLVAEPTKWKG